MKTDNRPEARQPARDRAAEAGRTDGAMTPQAPRKLTFAENAILTIKVLAICGLLGAALWVIEVWTSRR